MIELNPYSQTCGISRFNRNKFKSSKIKWITNQEAKIEHLVTWIIILLLENLSLSIWEELINLSELKIRETVNVDYL